MSKILPLPIKNFNMKLPLNKVNRLMNYRKNNFSSLSRRKSYKSPKLFKSNSMSSINEIKDKQRLFSLLDVNYKITNSRGTSLPNQFRRFSDGEQQQIFSFPYRIENTFDYIKPNDKIKDNNICDENEKNMERKKIKKCRISEDVMKLNNYFLKEKENVKGNNKLEKFNKTGFNFYNIRKNEIVNENSNKNYRLSLRKNHTKTPKGVSRNSTEELIKSNKKIIIEDSKENSKNKKDRWFPKGYDSYEILIKKPKLFNKKLRIEYSMKKILSSKSIEEKQYKSDIFFFKSPSEKEATNKNLNQYRDFQNSDIFNIKNDSQNISKSGEIYLFRNNDNLKYNISKESNSFWKITNSKFPTLTNYASKEYHILNPGIKGISFTKDRIMKECENKKDKNSRMINNVNYMNPIFKQKGLTEFIDMTRNGASNMGKDYMNTFNNNPKCFYKNNDIGTTLYNIHFQYKNLCQKPFVKNFFD